MPRKAQTSLLDAASNAEVTGRPETGCREQNDRKQTARRRELTTFKYFYDDRKRLLAGQSGGKAG